MTSRDAPDDLFWFAFRYVSDELDDSTRHAFEARLLHDSEACAAVAQAVDLLGVCLQLESAGAVDCPVRPFPRRSVFALTTVFAAASILVATVANPWSRTPADQQEGAGQTIPLELAWSSLPREPDLPVPEITLDDWRVDLAAGEDEGPMHDPDGELAPNPPHWLLVAVDRADSSGASEPGRSEN
ncbi:hypothetical protein [Tautonia marina]|uniref:hypothetical protein n=1 Tax=Tautonia marina TaxID=2653855 RepID=UPI00126101A0|nr:hypothetical protein [Tautonia marina]